jgi:hypothetical protein
VTINPGIGQMPFRLMSTAAQRSRRCPVCVSELSNYRQESAYKVSCFCLAGGW